jgi:hypothetical protein
MARYHDWIASRLPSQQQEMLLKAALQEGNSSLLTWRHLISLPGFDLQTPTNQQLMPLLYRNLRAQGLSHCLPDNLKIESMFTWTQNQRIFQRIQRTLPVLHDEKIPTLLLKGAALIPLYYRDYGARGMGDFDLLVPEKHFQRAIRLLRANGWKPVDDHRLENFDARFDQAIHMADEEDNCLDLHCHVLSMLSYGENSDCRFWEGSVPAVIANVETRTLCTTDHLIHTCVHGFHWADVKTVRWVADAGIILRRASKDIDWGRFVNTSMELGIILQVSETLAYLRKTFAWDIPLSVLDALQSRPVSRANRTLIQLRTQDIRDRPLKLILWHWLLYFRGMEGQEPLSRIFSISEYLKFWLKADSPGGVASNIVKKILLTLRYCLGLSKDDR